MAVPTIRFHIRILQEPTISQADMIQAMRDAYATAGIGVEVASVGRLFPPNGDAWSEIDTGPCRMNQASAEQGQLFGDPISHWSGWFALGAPPGGMIGPPGSVSRNADVCNVYARGADNALWQLSWAGGRWHGWGRHSDGAVLASRPAVDTMGPNHEHVFVRGTDGAVWHKYWTGSSGWQGWFNLGAPPGGFAGAPSAISRNSSFCNIYVRGNDNALWQRSWDGPAGRWHGWGRHNDGAVLASEPAVDSMGPNHEHVFVRGTDGAVWQKYWLGSSGWSGWFRLGAPPAGFVGAPSVVSRNGQFCTIYVRASDNSLWQRAWDGPAGRWRDWISHYDGGRISAEPAPGTMNGDHEHVFARGLDAALWHKYWCGGRRDREGVAYFVRAVTGTDGSLNGCASFPTGQPGAVVASYGSRYTLGHELGHVFGLPHLSGENCSQPGYQPTRLMTGCGTSRIVDPPAEVSSGEASTVGSSPLIVQR